jgi:hypothetical protein
MEEDDLILAQPMACLNLEVPLLQCLLFFVICEWNWLFISFLSAPLPSYEGLSSQWCSVFYHHRGTQQNDRLCLVGEAANFRKVLVQVHLTCQGFFFLPLHVQLKSAKHPRMSESTNLKDLEVVLREPE